MRACIHTYSVICIIFTRTVNLNFVAYYLWDTYMINLTEKIEITYHSSRRTEHDNLLQVWITKISKTVQKTL